MGLLQKTVQLQTYVAELKTVFEQGTPPENFKDKALFEQVKKDTQPVYDLLHVWEADALQYIKTNQAAVHPHQITSTRDNVELVLMHSYYIDVKPRRYMELNYSINYVLDILKDSLEREHIES